MEHFCLTGYFTLWLAAVDALKKYDADARKSAYQRIKSLLTDDFLTSGSALQMPMVLGMGMELPEKQDEKKPYILLKYAEQKYPVSMGDTPAGNARRACGVRSLHGLAPCVPAPVFCGLFLHHAILYYKRYRDRIW